jgi:hypothetical protein
MTTTTDTTTKGFLFLNVEMVNDEPIALIRYPANQKFEVKRKTYTEVLATIYSKEIDLDECYRRDIQDSISISHLENLLREHKRAERNMIKYVPNAEELKQVASDKVKAEQKALMELCYKRWCDRVCEKINQGCVPKHRTGSNEYGNANLYAKCTTDDKLEMLTTVISSMLCPKWVDIIDRYLCGSHLCIDGSIVPCKVGEIEGFKEMMELRHMCIRKEIHTKNRTTWASKVATHLVRFVKIETLYETDDYFRKIPVKYLTTIKEKELFWAND